MVIAAVNPVFHCVTIEYVTWHAPPPPLAPALVIAFAAFEGADSPEALAAVTR
jgi:hypothetical protein